MFATAYNWHRSRQGDQQLRNQPKSQQKRLHENSLTAKETTSRGHTAHSTSYTSGKELISRIYKELQTFNAKGIRLSLDKQANELTGSFLKRKQKSPVTIL